MHFAEKSDSASPFFGHCISGSMEVSTHYLGGAKFEVEARGHRVICDQPLDNGGADEGMSPPEFLLASLATCAGYYAAQYLNARKLPAVDLRVRVSAGKKTQPARLASFRITVVVPGLEERHRESVLRAVKSCLIHHTLLSSPEVEVELEAGPLQSEAVLALGTNYRN
jgi:putative redox protein